MILFPDAEALVLELLHQLVEKIHYAVGILLPHMSQPAAEILFVEQVHGITDGMQGLDGLAVNII